MKREKHIKTTGVCLFVINSLFLGLAASTNQNAVTNGSAVTSPAKNLVRSYSIDLPTFTRNLQREMSEKKDEPIQELFYKFLKSKKIEIANSSDVFIKKEVNQLLVRATKEQLDQIDPLVNHLNGKP